ncbi:MAG: Arc family DNA-binding protein [Parvularculaceae bacterium]
MKSITIRKVPEEIHRQLRIRAARNGRSLESELRAVLGALARPRPAPKPPQPAEPMPLTQDDMSIDAGEARRKVREILRREGA